MDRWQQALVPDEEELVAVQVPPAGFVRMRSFAALWEDEHVV